MSLELTYQSEHHWAADIREEDDTQTQYNGQRNRTFRIIGFHTRCSYNIKSDERVEASRRPAEHLGQYKFYWNFHGHHQYDYFSGTYYDRYFETTDTAYPHLNEIQLACLGYSWRLWCLQSGQNIGSFKLTSR